MSKPQGAVQSASGCKVAATGTGNPASALDCGTADFSSVDLISDGITYDSVVAYFGMLGGAYLGNSVMSQFMALVILSRLFSSSASPEMAASPTCVLGDFTGVVAVVSIQEIAFAVPNAPLQAQWLRCSPGGTLTFDPTPVTFTVGGGALGNIVEIFGNLPPGVNPVGGNVGFQTFALPQGGVRVSKSATFFLPAP